MLSDIYVHIYIYAYMCRNTHTTWDVFSFQQFTVRLRTCTTQIRGIIRYKETEQEYCEFKASLGDLSRLCVAIKVDREILAPGTAVTGARGRF